jgi:hypothetical protein
MAQPECGAKAVIMKIEKMDSMGYADYKVSCDQCGHESPQGGKRTYATLAYDVHESAAFDLVENYGVGPNGEKGPYSGIVNRNCAPSTGCIAIPMKGAMCPGGRLFGRDILQNGLSVYLGLDSTQEPQLIDHTEVFPPTD